MCKNYYVFVRVLKLRLRGCPFWTLSSANVGNNGYMSLTMGPWKDQRKRVVWSHVSHLLQYHVIKDAGASLTWGTFGTWMRFGKKASWGRQWDALGTVLLPVNGVFFFFKMCPLPQHCCCTAFHRNLVPDVCGLFQQGTVSYHKAKNGFLCAGSHSSQCQCQVESRLQNQHNIRQLLLVII